LPATISEAQMASPNARSITLGVFAFILVLAGFYLIDPTLFGLLSMYDGFADKPTLSANSNSKQPAGMNETAGATQKQATMGNANAAMAPPMDDASGNVASFTGAEGFADVQDVTGPAGFESAANPAGCYPRDQLTPGELLPKDPNSVWAQQNPMGTGSLKGKNFLSAGALIGVNTVGQSLRNANHQLRSEPPNPQVPVTVFNNSTIEPDTNRRDLEVN
jgi:hypothetical protein